MSAFLCHGRHFDLLADACAAILGAPFAGNEQAVGELLLRENERSLVARYGAAENVAALYRYAPTPLVGRQLDRATLSAVHMAARCYDYQSCESDDYHERHAARLAAKLRERVEAMLGGKPLDVDGFWSYDGSGSFEEARRSQPRRVEGSKYAATKDLSLVEVAKLTRADITAAMKAGALPRGKASVRTSRHRCIDVTFTPAAPASLVCEEYARDLARDPHARHWCDSDAPCRATQNKLEDIREAYNYDASDTMSYYFNQRFYGSACVRGVYEATEAAAQAMRAASMEGATN